MADPVVPPLPPKGEIVSQQALYNTQITLYRNSLGFGGMRNPTMIWDAMLRNDGSGIPMYRELEEKDEDVSNALDTLKMQARGRPHMVSPFDDSARSIEVADFIRAQLEGLPDFDLVMDNCMDAVGYGFSIGEMVFDTSMGQASLLDIKDCPQELFLFGERFQPQIGPLQFLTQPWASSGDPVPEGKFLINSYRPRGRNRMGRPLLRSVFWPSWFKRNVQRLWMLYAEKGPGTVVVRYPDSDDASGQQLAAEIAQAIRDGVALGVPMNFEYDKELLTSSRPMDPAVYEHFFESLQLSIVRKILGETLTSFGSDKGRGALALGDVHSDMLEKKAISLCKATAGVFNAQVVRPLVLWNFGPDAPMPKWGYDVGQSEDLDKAINRDQKLQTMGLPITQQYLYKKYSVPQPGPADVLCTAAPNTVDVPVPDAEDVTFAERTRRRSARERNQRIAESQLADFDQVLSGLQDEATKLLAQRTAEIVHATAPGGH